MIGFYYYWPTPNSWKISIMLEECGLPYRMIPVNMDGAASSSPSSWPSAQTAACRPLLIMVLAANRFRRLSPGRSRPYCPADWRFHAPA